MTIAAISGVTKPAMASGTQTSVVDEGHGEILQGHPPRPARNGDRFQHGRELLALENEIGGTLTDVGGTRR